MKDIYITNLKNKERRVHSKEYTKTKAKCDDNDIKLRVANRFYPSSKMCHNCGYVKN